MCDEKDYNKIESSRNISRRAEEIIRAEASKCHQTRTFKDGMKTGYRIRRLNVAHKYLPGAGKLIHRACNIFLAEKLRNPCRKFQGASRKEIIQDAIEEFEDFNDNQLSYYISAALIDDPNRAVIIASNAFHNFLGLHVEYLKRKLGLRNNECNFNDGVRKKARMLWNKMKPEQKFPFFLLAYLNSYYPRELDGSTAQTFTRMSQKEINTSLIKAQDTIRNYDKKNSNPKKNVSFSDYC